jgi:hypothetical protein
LYDVAADGRFLVAVGSNEGGTAPVYLVINWTRPLTEQ